MKGIEFFRNMSIGQYVDTGSSVHRLTPATKYLGLLSIATPAIAGGPLAVLLAFAATLAVGRVARVPLTFILRGLKAAVPILAIVVLLQILFGWTGDRSPVLVRIGPVAITGLVLRNAAMTVMRTFTLMTIASLFTSLVTESEAAHGIEDSLAPLGRLGLPVHALALAVATAFRFVPILGGELESIVKAQAARGADFGSGRGGPLHKARAYLPLFVPVTIRALERAEALAEAMEARCYTGDGRVRWVVYPKQEGENAVRIGVLGFAVLALILGYLL